MKRCLSHEMHGTWIWVAFTQGLDIIPFTCISSCISACPRGNMQDGLLVTMPQNAQQFYDVRDSQVEH